MLKLLVLIFSAVCEINAANLPSYFSACGRSDQNLSKCALESGSKGLPTFMKGDSGVNVPRLLPLSLTEINLEVGPNLKFKFTDCKLFGLETAVLKSVDIDLKQNKLKIEVMSDFQLISQYKVDGRILVLPIIGKGPSNLNITEGNFIFTSDLQYYDKKNIKYIKIVNENLSFTIKKMDVHFGNLFNGDPRLGPELNRFFSENWKEVSHELYPALRETIQQIILNVAGNFLSKIPFDKLFTE